MAKSICAVVRGECPRTNDPSAKVFCPWWSNNLPDTLLDGSYRLSIGHTLVGCSIPLVFRYLISGIVEADHAHAAANESREASLQVKAQLLVTESSIRGAVLTPLIESLSRPVGGGSVDSDSGGSGLLEVVARKMIVE